MTLYAPYDRTLHTPRPIATTLPAFPPSAQQSLYPSRRPDAVHPTPILQEPSTPTSTRTVRSPNASPTAMDGDLLHPTIHQTTRKRSSSRTYRWIEEQQHHRTPDDRTSLADCHPYLAYPQMSVSSFVKTEEDSVDAVGSYVFTDKELGHPPERVPRVRDALVTPAVRPETPTKTLSHRKSRNSSLFQASPLRSLHLTFTARRPSTTVSGPPRPHSPVSSNSASTFRRKPERAVSHSRGSSSNAIQHIPEEHHLQVPETPPKSTTWKFNRPPVTGHLTARSDHDSEGSPPPRPSTSSSVTHSGSSTTYTRTSSDAPRKMYFGSIRSQSSTTIFSTSPSLWSLPTDASHINDPPESTKVIARDRVTSSYEGAPIAWKPAAPANLGNMSNLLTGPKARRKRKLIISGIPPDDERRFEGARKWCESFGELSSIMRVPNGDLHVDFRKGEVADTVCRLNARVYIAGVGSVCLSWFTGKRP